MRDYVRTDLGVGLQRCGCAALVSFIGVFGLVAYGIIHFIRTVEAGTAARGHSPPSQRP